MAMTRMIDLNANLGEGGGKDIAIIPFISSCNIACGGHAGNETFMSETTLLAKLHNVRVGALPSYPDRRNFGLTSMTMREIDLEASLNQQLNLLREITSEQGVPVVHVKPHGALYHDAANIEKLAWLVVSVARDVFPHAAIMGPPNSKLELVCKQQHRHFIREGFVDIRYTDSGTLVPASHPFAMIDGDVERSTQALALAQGDFLQTDSGGLLRLKVDSLYLQTAATYSLKNASSIRHALETANFTIQAHINGH